MAKERHSFSSGSELAHAFAHQTSTYGRRADGRMYFEAEPKRISAKVQRVSTIYSYGPHFPIASLYDTPQGRICLFTSRGYSSSTSQHKSYVSYAVSHLSPLYVVNPRQPEDTKAKAKAAIAAALTALKDPKERKLSTHLGAIWHVVNDANALAAALGFKWRLKPPALCSNFALLARATAQDEKAQAAAAKREERRQWRYDHRAEWQRERDLNALKRWRKDPDASLPHNARAMSEWTQADNDLIEARVGLRIAAWRASGHNGWALPGGTYLRIDGQNIVTSKGANFPLAHGVRAWPFILKVRAGGQPWHTNGHKVPLGHYQIDRIDADGTVVAGCHVVPFAEIERIAKELHLEGVAL